MAKFLFEPISEAKSFHFFFFYLTQIRLIYFSEQSPFAATIQWHKPSSSRSPSSYDHLHSLDTWKKDLLGYAPLSLFGIVAQLIYWLTPLQRLGHSNLCDDHPRLNSWSSNCRDVACTLSTCASCPLLSSAGACQACSFHQLVNCHSLTVMVAVVKKEQ